METAQPIPVLSAIARNLVRLRKLRSMTVRQLSERLTELGAPLVPSGITKVEKGARQVSTEELLTFAAALNASPADLLDPGDSRLQVAPRLPAVQSHVLRFWLAGQEPVPPEADIEMFRQAAPDWFRKREEREESTFRHPAMMSATNLRTFMRTAILGEEGVDPPTLAKAMRDEVARLSTYVDLLASEVEQGRADGR